MNFLNLDTIFYLFYSTGDMAKLLVFMTAFRNNYLHFMNNTMNFSKMVICRQTTSQILWNIVDMSGRNINIQKKLCFHPLLLPTLGVNFFPPCQCQTINISQFRLILIRKCSAMMNTY